MTKNLQENGLKNGMDFSGTSKTLFWTQINQK
jgi:hypothetical protein